MSKLSTYATKATPVAADSIAMVDSEASDAVKRLAFSALLTYLQSNGLVPDVSALTALVSGLADADKLQIYDNDAGTVKRVDLSVLVSDYLSGSFLGPDFSTLTALSSGLADTDLIAIDDASGGDAKKTQLSELVSDYLATKFLGLDFSTLTALSSGLADGDLLAIDDASGGDAKKTTLSEFVSDYLNGPFAYGTYTPTYTAVSGISSINTVYSNHYQMIGNVVFLSGHVDLTPSTTGVVSVRTSLAAAIDPPSGFSSANDVTGTSDSAGGTIDGGDCRANTANDEVEVRMRVNSTALSGFHWYAVYVND